MARMSLDLSVALDATVQKMADESGCSKSDIFRRSVALLLVAVEAVKSGKTIGIAKRPGEPIEKEIVGILP